MYRTLFLLTLGVFMATAPTIGFAQAEDAPITGSGSVYCPQLSQTMVRGARDRSTVPPGQVTELQKFISDYYDVDPDDIITGYFGALTHRHVVRFQQEQGLPSFGIVGPMTRAAIARVCGNNPVAAQIPTLSATPTSGPSPLTVAFTLGNLTNAPGLYVISYGNGSRGIIDGTGCTTNNAGCSSAMQHTYTYNTPGTYTASIKRSCTAWFYACSGTALASSTITVSTSTTVLPPTLSLSAKQTTIAPGTRAVLVWSTANATRCSAEGGWSGTKATSGTEETVVLWATTTFALTCFGSDGTSSVAKSVTVGVIPEDPTQKRSCTQDGVTIAHGASRTFYGYQAPESGNACRDNLIPSQLRTCNDGVLSGSYPYASCTIPSISLVPVITFSANPTSIAPGKQATLTWTSTNATQCSAGGGWSGAKELSGTFLTAALWQTTTFTLTCTGPGYQTPTTKSVTVTVIPDDDALSPTLSATPTSGLSPLTVTFTVGNLANLTNRMFTILYGDGTSGTIDGTGCTVNNVGCGGSTVQNTHTYNTPGTYTASISYSCKLGFQGCIDYGPVVPASITITVGTTSSNGSLTDANCAPLVVMGGGIGIEPATGAKPLPVTVSFYVSSIYQWTGFDFGDGTKLDPREGSPLVRVLPSGASCTRHTYAVPGTYTIRQTLNGSPLACSYYTCKTVTVH